MSNVNKPNPVLLIHGLNDTTAIFRTMSNYLTKSGWSVYSFNMTPSNGTVGLNHLGVQVADYIAKTFAPEQTLDIVGLSMGGIVSRYYVQRLGGINRVQRLISLCSPHHGTMMAYLSQQPGCVQLRPDSAFLWDLNRDTALLEQLNFTSIWTPFDLIIVPARSSVMPVGRNIIVPVLGHNWIVKDLRGLKAVATALCEPLRV